MGFTPTYDGTSLELYIGTWGAGRARAGNHTLDLCVFPVLPGQSSAVQFTSADVGCPIAIVGAGPVDPLTPSWYGIPGSTWNTTIASVNSSSSVQLTDAPPTSFYNTGVNNIAVYRLCQTKVDTIDYKSSVAPGTRDTLAFVTLQSYDYFTRNQSLNTGQPVYLKSTDPAVGDIFGGLIDVQVISNQDSNSPSGPSGGSGLSIGTVEASMTPFSYSCQCVSWDQIASRRVVQPERATTYTNSDAGVIMNSVVVTNLDGEGIAFENDVPPLSISPYVSGLPVINFAVPAGAVISDLLNQLCSQMNAADPTKLYFWYTDEWKVVHLTERTVAAAPWNVDDTAGSDGNVLVSVSVQVSHNQLANDCYIVASEYLGNEVPVTFVGNGTATTFNLPSMCVETPAIALNGVAQTVGVLNVDSGVQWYWSQGSTAIVQGTGSVLQSTDTLIVTFQLSQPAVGVAFNDAGLTERANVEGPGALYQSAQKYDTPVTQAQLLAMCESLAEEYGAIPMQVQAATLRPGLKTGQFQTITLADIAVDGSFLISSIDMTTVNNVIVWNYTAINGSNIGNWVTGWNNFINKGLTGYTLTEASVPIEVALNTITIDHTKVVGGADIADFIFCFTGTYDWLKLKPTGGVANANGSDIWFSTDVQGSNVLPFDLAFYNSTSGQITAFVLLPNLSHSSDTVLYIQYGDASVVVSKANPAGTWSPFTDVSGTPNDNYHGVYHLGESGAPYHDSSKYGNNSTGTANNYPTPTNGPFGTAQFFSQTSGGESVQLPALLTGNGFSNKVGTLECWWYSARQHSGTIYFDAIVNAQTTSGPEFGPAIASSASGSGAPEYGTGMLTNSSSFSFVRYTGIVINDSNWHKLVFAFDTAHGKIYVDGVYGGDIGYGEDTALTGITWLCAATRPGNYEAAEGALAEVWVAQYAKGAGQITTEWNNQSSPSTFYSLSESVTGPALPPIPVLGNPQGTVTNLTGALTLNEPVFGNGGTDVKVGTKQGSTTQAQMASGAAGATGAPLVYDASGNAVAGALGELVPAGGTAGQVLTKNSSTNYDVSWQQNDDDIQCNGATSLNIIQVNATQVWIGQTEIQFNGTFI